MANWHFLYSWFADPRKFYQGMERWYRDAPVGLHVVAVLLSYLVPVGWACALTLLWIDFPIEGIAHRFVPWYVVSLVWLVGSLLVHAFMACCDGVSRKLVQVPWGSVFPSRNTPRSVNNPVENGATPGERDGGTLAPPSRSKQGRASLLKVLRALKLDNPGLSVLKGNLQMLPLFVTFMVATLAVAPRPWNIYHLGIFFCIKIMTATIWCGGVVQLGLSGKDGKGSAPWWLHVLNAIASVAVFLVFYILLDAVLEPWLGAMNMPLWFKIAVAFLHGQ